MRTRTMAGWERQLREPLPDARFGPAETRGLPEPVRRYLHAAIAPGAPLFRSVHMRMRGHIKVGRWLPFHARQILNPHKGFIWSARAAGLIAGADHYIDDVGVMRWRVAGMIDVAVADGPDVSRSSAGRACAESIWLPTALLPRFGVVWSAHEDEHISAVHELGPARVELHLRLTPAGRISSLVFARWGDPDLRGEWSLNPFGGEITGYRTFAGLTVPSAGRMGWHAGTERWRDGEFYRFAVSHLQPA